MIRDTFVILMVSGKVGDTDFYEEVRITFDRPIKLYDQTPGSPYMESCDVALKLVVGKLKCAPEDIKLLRIAPRTWSDDVDELNEGLIPIPEGP